MASNNGRFDGFHSAAVTSLLRWPRCTGLNDTDDPMFPRNASLEQAAASQDAADLCRAFDASLPLPYRRSAIGGQVLHDQVLVMLIELQHWLSWVSEAWDLINEVERGRVLRRRFAADRDALVLSYAMHRLLLGSLLGCAPTDVALIRDMRGCPMLVDGALFTSLSHADGCIALAVTGSGPVGVDVESSARAAAMSEIADCVCHPLDAVALGDLQPPALGMELLALWVRKESLLKAAGVGLEREMSGFAAPADGLLPLSPPAGSMTQLQMLDAGPWWVAAVAAPPGIEVASLWLRPAGQ